MTTPYQTPVDARARSEESPDIFSMLAPLGVHWKAVLLSAVLAGVAGAAISYLVPLKYTAATVFLPPQKQQGGAASAIAALGTLSSLAGNAAVASNTADEYIALMQSVTVSDRIIEKFGLRKEWQDEFQVDSRVRLAKRVNITSGKKDGMIRVEVTDTQPARAAAMANQYVEELRTLNKTLALTEAQQRRVFFERLLEQTRDKLAAAQRSLEGTGFNAGALNSEPRDVAEAYANIKALLTTAEVKLQVLRNGLSDGSPEVQSQQQAVAALTAQLAKIESQDKAHTSSSDYITRYREYKYQDTLFDLFARQYENARVDESREGALLQVLDPATPPERKSWPSRSIFAIVGGLLGAVGSLVYFSIRRRRALAH